MLDHIDPSFVCYQRWYHRYRYDLTLFPVLNFLYRHLLLLFWRSLSTKALLQRLVMHETTTLLRNQRVDEGVPLPIQ